MKTVAVPTQLVERPGEPADKADDLYLYAWLSTGGEVEGHAAAIASALGWVPDAFAASLARLSDAGWVHVSNLEDGRMRCRPSIEERGKLPPTPEVRLAAIETTVEELLRELRAVKDEIRRPVRSYESTGGPQQPELTAEEVDRVRLAYASVRDPVVDWAVIFDVWISSEVAWPALRSWLYDAFRVRDVAFLGSSLSGFPDHKRAFHVVVSGLPQTLMRLGPGSALPGRKRPHPRRGRAH